MSAEDVLNRVVKARDAFESLGVLRSYNVEDAEIRAAFRATALLLHPDKLPPHLSSDAASVDKYSHAFVKLSESYASIKTEAARHELIRQIQEEEMRRQIQLRDIRDQQQAAAAQPTRRPTQTTSKTSVARKPTKPFGSPSREDAHAPKPSFPGFTGSKVRVAPPKSMATAARPPNRTPAPASATATAAAPRSVSSTSTSAAAAASRQSDSVDVTSSESTEDFLAQLLKWKLAFKTEMESERNMKSQSVLDAYGSEGQLRAIQSKIGASIFMPAQISASSSTALQSLYTAPNSADNSSASKSAPVAENGVSRLQQMRARQQGLAKPAATSTAQATSSSSSPAFPLSVTLPLTSGSRFRLRTVKAPGETPAPPIYVSVWVDQSVRLLQWRLTTSAHSHPDGVISVDRIADVRRMSKPVGDLWWSVVMTDGQSMCFEATSTDMRETWVNCLSTVVRGTKC